MPESINISASRGAAILGLSKYRTPVEAWLDIMEQRKPGFCAANSYVTPESEYNVAMQFGHAFEDAIVALYSITTNRVIQHRELYVKSRNDYYITTHIDGISVDNKIGLDGDKLYEAKTTNIRSWRESWGDPGTDQIPADYMIQVQHQMICTRDTEVDVCVLILPESQDWLAENGKSIAELDTMRIAQSLSDLGFFKIYHVQKNDRLQGRMIEAYRDFWETHVIGEIPPEPQKYDDVRKICPAPSGTIVANEVLEQLCNEYNQTNSALNAANQRKDELKKMITNGMRKLSADAHEDPESIGKWRLLDRRGRQIASYSGDRFNVSKGA